jgi:hypothetical protein
MQRMLLVPGYAGMLVCFWKAARRKAGAMHRPWDQGWPGHGVQQATTLEPPAGPSTCNTTRQCWRLECPTQWLCCIVAYWQSSSSVVEACSLKQPLISTFEDTNSWWLQASKLVTDNYPNCKGQHPHHHTQSSISTGTMHQE